MPKFGQLALFSPSIRPADAADWIVAPATPPGPGAVAIVRVDGPGCWTAVARVWRTTGREDAHANEAARVPARVPEPRRLTLGILSDLAGRAIDQCLLAWFPGPHSYTGNDLVEFHCHGGPAIVAAAVDALLAAGARPARPGEFTERAFLNGRMDLAEAEAVAALVAARTDAAARAALAQLEGGLSRPVAAVRGALLDAAAEIEARLDFPEDEMPPADAARLAASLASARDAVRALLATERRGRLLSEGARIAIAGRPNTGKSSLFNALVGRERALVTPHAGTTRDTIEATLDLGGMPIVLVDTAGVRRDGAGEIEALGIERSLREVRTADLVLLVLDASQAPDDEDRHVLAETAGRPVLVVANKCDLPEALPDAALRATLRPVAEAESTVEKTDESAAAACPPALPPTAAEPPLLRVSALRPASLAPLEHALTATLLGPSAQGEEGALVTNERQANRLRTAESALARAAGLMAGHAEGFAGRPAPGEIVMVEVNEALAALGEILGLAVGEEVLDRIFSRFCIGK